MTNCIQHPHEPVSNRNREDLAVSEPRSLRTFTPTQAVLAESAGVFHWTPEGRRLYDFSSGVLVANLGHNPRKWMERFFHHMGYKNLPINGNPCRSEGNSGSVEDKSFEEFFRAAPMTAYNAVTPVEVAANRMLLDLMKGRPGGGRMEQVMWAASGSEAVQKALWACLARDPSRDIILATRFGFHGKKGLSHAITGSEQDKERDQRVKFISFPMAERKDVSQRYEPFDFGPYEQELDNLLNEFGKRITALCTEPYLGGGGSYHPPKEYLQGLQGFCRKHDILFVLDEVQSNFGRTGDWFAFETYGLEPDLVILGKGLGNGVPVAAVVGRRDILGSLEYGDASDTWSANPLQAGATLATIEEFQRLNVLSTMKKSSAIIEAGLVRLKEFPFVANVRGEKGGMVWGVEFCDHAGRTGPEWANQFVLANYVGGHFRSTMSSVNGQESDGVHLLGPLAKKVVRISPPLVITPDQAKDSLEMLYLAAGALMRQGKGV